MYIHMNEKVDGVHECTCTWSIDDLGFSGVEHLANLSGHQRLPRACMCGVTRTECAHNELVKCLYIHMERVCTVWAE